MNRKEVVIRDFLKPGDIGYLTYLQGKHYFEEFGFNIEYEALVARLFNEYVNQDTERKGIWVAEHGNKPVGCVALFRKTEDEGRLRLLFVHPGYRGRGLGSKLVNNVITAAKEMGYSMISLSTESILESAAGIYKKTGFAIKEEYVVKKWGHELIHQGYVLEL